MTGSIRIFEKLNFTPKLSALAFLKVKLPNMTDWQNQIADSLSKKTEIYERQEQREADRPEIKDVFFFMDKETYDSLPLTRWLDKSGKPIEDHPELPKEPPGKTILKKTRGIPIGMMLKSKIVRETLKSRQKAMTSTR